MLHVGGVYGVKVRRGETLYTAKPQVRQKYTPSIDDAKKKKCNRAVFGYKYYNDFRRKQTRERNH